MICLTGTKVDGKCVDKAQTGVFLAQRNHQSGFSGTQYLYEARCSCYTNRLPRHHCRVREVRKSDKVLTITLTVLRVLPHLL
jgi:hypothetical protein